MFRKNMYLLPEDRCLALIGVKICTMVELCRVCGFLHFWWRYLYSTNTGAKNVFWTFCLRHNFDNLRRTHIQLSTDAWPCHLSSGEWILFISLHFRWFKNIAESSSLHGRTTTSQTTDRRQTDGSCHKANV